MTTVATIKEIIKDYKDDDVIAIKYFELHEAEEIYQPEAGDSIIADNWSHIAQQWEKDGEVDQVTSDAFREAIAFCVPYKDER